MAKFKVGDIVTRGSAHLDGAVTAVNRQFGIDYATIDYGADWGEWKFRFDELELVKGAPKFAVGDRVRCVNPADSPFGLVGVIVVADASLLVEFDGWTGGHGNYENQWYLQPADLEPAAVAPQPQPLTIQAGRYYKTRDGRKVGPMEVFEENSGQLKTDQKGRVAKFIARDLADNGTGGSYTAAGEWLTGEEGYGYHLVAEWPAEDCSANCGCAAAEVDNLRDEYGPFDEANDNGKPKFKVGDRVRVTDPSLFRVGTRVGDLGTVTSDYYGNGNDYVNIDLDHTTEGKIDQIARQEHIELAPATLSVTITTDTSALDAEIDRVKRRLKKLAKRARKLGIRLDYDLAA